LALRSVQQNNAQFGDDPHYVTIGGVSAGGGSVYLHLPPMPEGMHRTIPSILKMQLTGTV